MPARVFDSLAGAPVALPVSEGDSGPELKLYVCGITPYDSGHLGHAFTYATFDVLARWAEANGVRVRYVQNVTDVDDPLFERARRDGVDWRALAEQGVGRLLEDMGALGWREPDIMPRVSTEVPSILRAVEELEDGGYAYRAGSVYYDTSRFPGYGELSHRSRRSMLRKLRDEGLLGEVGPGAKRDALDFPLWRGSAPDEPAWESRFGPGRPGWHIECSAMAMRYLGPTIDVHGGGRDLAFSHHESERAQSMALTGKPFARAWMHVGMVRYEGHKMSKSLGNLVKVPECLAQASPTAVRLLLASHHWRRDWTFRFEELARHQALVERLGAMGVVEGGGPRPATSALADEFAGALDDCLDTPRAVRVLRRAATRRDAAAASWMLGILAGSASLATAPPARREP